MALSKEFLELRRRTQGTVDYLQRNGVKEADAMMFAGALHHTQAVDRVKRVAKWPWEVAAEVPKPVSELLQVRLRLEATHPVATKAQRDALVARAVRILTGEGE